MDPVRVGILGCGKISSAYFAGLPDYRRYLKLEAAADIAMAAANRASEEFGVPAMTVDELLTTDEIELIINLTLPSAHAPLNIQILESGKHAYCEKPFSVTRRSGTEVLEEAESYEKLIGCAPDMVLGEGIQSARKLLESGEIGEPKAVYINVQSSGPEHWHPNPGFFYKRGGGPLWDQGPYFFTALVNFFGPARRVVALSGQSFEKRVALGGPSLGKAFPVEVPTRYQLLVEFVSGLTVSASFSFDTFGRSDLPPFEILGTEGTMAVPSPALHTGEVYISKETEEHHGDQPRALDWQRVRRSHCHRGNRALGPADMAAAIRTGRAPRASAEVALHIVDLFRCIDQSIENAGWEGLTTTCVKPALMPEGLNHGEVEE